MQSNQLTHPQPPTRLASRPGNLLTHCWLNRILRSAGYSRPPTITRSTSIQQSPPPYEQNDKDHDLQLPCQIITALEDRPNVYTGAEW